MTEPRGRRKNNKPWKRIYGVDRRYTARVDRLRERQADTAAMHVEIARYSTVLSEEFTTLDEFTATGGTDD